MTSAHIIPNEWSEFLKEDSILARLGRQTHLNADIASTLQQMRTEVLRTVDVQAHSVVHALWSTTNLGTCGGVCDVHLVSFQQSALHASAVAHPPPGSPLLKDHGTADIPEGGQSYLALAQRSASCHLQGSTETQPSSPACWQTGLH